MKKTIALIVMIGAALLMSGCSASQKWYKPDCGQVDFNLDDLECRLSAEEMARQATLTGEKTDLEVYVRAYSNCLFAKGWTHTAPGSKPKKEPPETLAAIHGDRAVLFGRQLKMPPGLHLVRNRISSSQGLKSQTLSFRGDGPVFLTMIVQETLSRKFAPVDYPVDEPFFVFEKGADGKNPDRLRWTVFGGKFKGAWVAGIGAYLRVDQNRRITFVLTRNISDPESAPPTGLRLTKKQYLEVTAFADTWHCSGSSLFGMTDYLK